MFLQPRSLIAVSLDYNLDLRVRKPGWTDVLVPLSDRSAK